MDFAGSIFDHLRPESSGRGSWWGREHHRRCLRTDRRYFVHHQPLIPIFSGAQPPVKEAVFRIGLYLWKVYLLELMILVLVMQCLLSFFGQSIFPGILHTGGFIYTLSVLIVVLIIIKFLV